MSTETDNFIVAEAQLAIEQAGLFNCCKTAECSSSLVIKARQAKAERIKTFGEPIQLLGKALGLEIRNGFAWIAENTTVIRKLELEVSDNSGFPFRLSHNFKSQGKHYSFTRAIQDLLPA